MRYVVLSLCVLLGSTFSVKAADPPRDEALDKSVDRALAFLQGSQLNDGGWTAGPQAGGANPAVTSLAVMAFLSAGHVPGEGRYGETVEKGIRWVLKAQQDNGLFAGNGGQEMYHHGIATLMLAEAAGMTDGKLGDEIRTKLVKAVEIILKAQRGGTDEARGGWRYHVLPVDSPNSDISVTGWQIMALRAAKNVGCDVPADVIDRAVEYIRRCQDHNTGAFKYTTNEGASVACTGTSVLSLELCGKNQHRAPDVLKAGAYLLSQLNPSNHPPQWNPWTERFGFYSRYYCSQATFQLGGNYWEFYRPLLHELLFSHQKDDGSWFAPGGDGNPGGPNYCTAMSVLALAVEYRYLPIYQRDEEPADKK